MKEIKITCKGSNHIEIGKLKDFQGNLKNLEDEDFHRLKNSILKHGFSFPVFVWKDNILDGHQRIFVTRKLVEEGYTIGKIPVVDIEAHDEKEAAEKLLYLNSRYASMTDDGLLEYLENFDLDIAEFSDDLNLPEIDMEVFLEGLPGDDDGEHNDGSEDEIPEVVEPICKPGDLWLLGEHRLLCGDSTDRAQVDRLMAGQKADMVFADPPYGINVVDKSGKIGGSVCAKNQIYKSVIGDDNDYDPSNLFNLSDLVLIWGANYFSDKLPVGQWIVWDKDRPSGTTFSDCEVAWTSKKGVAIKKYKCTWHGMIREGESDKRVHPTQKPVKMCSDVISDFSIETDIILDPFLGSGTTLIACGKTNRKCYGMEIDPHYCDVIIKRWEEYSGKKAELKKP